MRIFETAGAASRLAFGGGQRDEWFEGNDVMYFYFSTIFLKKNYLTHSGKRISSGKIETFFNCVPNGRTCCMHLPCLLVASVRSSRHHAGRAFLAIPRITHHSDHAYHVLVTSPNALKGLKQLASAPFLPAIWPTGSSSYSC